MNVSDVLERENNNLDLIRIILACLVIAGHTSILNGDSKYWVDPVGYFMDYIYSGSFGN